MMNMSLFRPPGRRDKHLTWIMGGIIAAASAYIAYRLLMNPHVSSRARWSSTVTAALMLLLFSYSLFDPNVWTRVLGARLPGKGSAAVIGHLVAMMLIALFAVLSIWSLRGWIWT